jgi:hypothetical protein
MKILMEATVGFTIREKRKNVSLIVQLKKKDSGISVKSTYQLLKNLLFNYQKNSALLFLGKRVELRGEPQRTHGLAPRKNLWGKMNVRIV